MPFFWFILLIVVHKICQNAHILYKSFNRYFIAKRQKFFLLQMPTISFLSNGVSGREMPCF